MSDERHAAIRLLFEKLELDLHRSALASASGWIVVSVDEQDTPRRVVNASGPYPDPQTALLAAAQMDSDDRRWSTTDWKHEVVPLFAP